MPWWAKGPLRILGQHTSCRGQTNFTRSSIAISSDHPHVLVSGGTRHLKMYHSSICQSAEI